MADDGAGKTGGKGALGELVKAESMIQLAIALPAGCLIGWLAGSWLDRHCRHSAGRVGGIYSDIPDGVPLSQERSLMSREGEQF